MVICQHAHSCVCSTEAKGDLCLRDPALAQVRHRKGKARGQALSKLLHRRGRLHCTVHIAAPSSAGSRGGIFATCLSRLGLCLMLRLFFCLFLRLLLLLDLYCCRFLLTLLGTLLRRFLLLLPLPCILLLAFRFSLFGLLLLTLLPLLICTLLLLSLHFFRTFLTRSCSSRCLLRFALLLLLLLSPLLLGNFARFLLLCLLSSLTSLRTSCVASLLTLLPLLTLLILFPFSSFLRPINTPLLAPAATASLSAIPSSSLCIPAPPAPALIVILTPAVPTLRVLQAAQANSQVHSTWDNKVSAAVAHAEHARAVAVAQQALRLHVQLEALGQHRAPAKLGHQLRHPLLRHHLLQLLPLLLQLRHLLPLLFAAPACTLCTRHSALERRDHAFLNATAHRPARGGYFSAGAFACLLPLVLLVPPPLRALTPAVAVLLARISHPICSHCLFIPTVCPPGSLLLPPAVGAISCTAATRGRIGGNGTLPAGLHLCQGFLQALAPCSSLHILVVLAFQRHQHSGLLWRALHLGQVRKQEGHDVAHLRAAIAPVVQLHLVPG
mmetsp:Transcript_16981/g.46976  ORF Transcript_16981/g.46976 Transcript_16981/m.46976 type:complete len:553 (+) Transcript_16981:1893-3551(+)